MLYVFNSAEQLQTVLKNDGDACPYYDAIHTEKLNGENVFIFTVPANHLDSQYVVEGNLVAFRDLDQNWQLFEIKRVTDVHGEGLTRTAYCEHIFYELLDDIVIDKRPETTARDAMERMLEGTRWQVGIVDDLGISRTNAYYESALSGIQKVANAWKGELRWRCLMEGGVIIRVVDLLAMRGTDTGKQFAYAKDILNIKREVDISGLATALYGRGKGVEIESGGYGRRLTFADVEWSVENGDPVDKPLGQEWVGDPEALERWGRPGSTGKRHRFDVFVDEDEEDPEALLQKTWEQLQQRKIPRVTYELDVISLEQLTGYEREQVRLGDLVRVIDREFNPPLVVSARIIELERDLLAPENTKVVLGSFAPSIVEAQINTDRKVEDLVNRPYNTKWLDGVIDVLQNEIENRHAYKWEKPEGTIILNAPTYEEATEALLIGGGRIALANQKDGQGGWEWRTFVMGSAVVADLIMTGILQGGKVKFDLDNGTFLIGEGTDNYLMYFDGQELHISLVGQIQEELNTRIDDTASQLEEQLSEEVNRLDETIEETNTSLEEVRKHFSFTAEGLTIGETGSPFSITISNDQIDFVDTGQVVAYINGQKMYISTVEILDSIVVGRHKIEKYDDEITLIRWVG